MSLSDWDCCDCVGAGGLAAGCGGGEAATVTAALTGDGFAVVVLFGAVAAAAAWEKRINLLKRQTDKNK